MFLSFDLANNNPPAAASLFMQMRTNECVIAQSFFISRLTSDLAAPLPVTQTLFLGGFFDTKALLILVNQN